MVFSAIGSKWGYYSLAQAASYDGYSWVRGRETTDEDLVLAPNRTDPKAWDHQMVEYASIWRASHAGGGGGSNTGGDGGDGATGGHSGAGGETIGLFYAGNGYGDTGIGYTETTTEEDT